MFYSILFYRYSLSEERLLREQIEYKILTVLVMVDEKVKEQFGVELPEDEAGFTMKELLDRIDTNGFPAKFILTKPLDNSHFKLYNV